jgi:hypothetical protein
VQGVCADCWGSKGGRQFWVRGNQDSRLLGYPPAVVGAALALVPAFLLLLLWILV